MEKKGEVVWFSPSVSINVNRPPGFNKNVLRFTRMKNKFFPINLPTRSLFSTDLSCLALRGFNRCANLRIIANVTYKYCRGFVNESRNCCDPPVAKMLRRKLQHAYIAIYSKNIFFHSSGKRENPIELSNGDFFYLKKHCIIISS